MTYDDLKKTVGRKRCQLVELQCDYCALTYGTSPCTAAVGVTGAQKCFNTRKTCQDPANYSPTVKSYVFSDQPVLLPPQGQMIIVAGQGEEFAISFDGDTYSIPPAPPDAIHFISTGDAVLGDVNLTTSNDDTTWHNVTSPMGPGVAIPACNYAAGLWLLGSVKGNPSGYDAAKSTDGVTWTSIVPLTNTSTIYNGFAHLRGKWYAFGDHAQYAYSLDGAAWTQVTSPLANTRWMESDGTALVMGGEIVSDDTHFYYSTDDGATWTEAPQDLGSTHFAVRHILYADGKFVAVGYTGGHNEGRIFTSANGHSWTYRTNPWNNLDGLTQVAFGNGVWVVGGVQAQLMTSPDAITWTLRASPGGSCNSIIFVNGLFYMASSNGFVYESADGITWNAGVSSGRTSSVIKIAGRP